jgi:hypothetical protein
LTGAKPLPTTDDITAIDVDHVVPTLALSVPTQAANRAAERKLKAWVPNKEMTADERAIQSKKKNTR